MPGEFFFMALGGLGVSLAGFAGLIAALTPEQQRSSAVARWRITRVVIWGLHASLLGFGIIAIFAFLEDASQTARVASGFAAMIFFLRSWRSTRPSPAWPVERQRRFAMALWTFEGLFVLGNVVLGNVAYLHVIMILFLVEPGGVFVAAIQDATHGPTAARSE